MKKIQICMLATLALALGLFTSCGSKESGTKLLLNEVLVINESNYQDDYGRHSAWVEIFNKSYTSADLAGWYLKCSSQPGDTVSYFIPKGDVLTQVKPRQHALFWADGEPNKGTFHTRFTLDPERANWIGLYDSGNKLMNEVTVPAGILGADQSYARVTDAAEEWEVKGGSADKYVTPSTNNKTLDSNAKRDKFARHDAAGIGMAISAMSVVFTGLILLYISFKFAGRTAVGMHDRHKARKMAEREARSQSLSAAKAAEPSASTDEAPSGEVYAAIAMALYELQANVHDVESNVLTIRRSGSSAWNDKSGTLRRMPQKR